MASGDNFYGDVVGDDFNGGYHWLEVVRDEFDVDAINFPMGDINISDSLHVGTTDEPFSNGLITSYTESNTYPAFRGVAVGDHTQAGWFAANGEAASGIFASAEGLDAYAGYFDGNVKIQSDSTNDSLYVISDGTGMAGRFESYDSDAVYGVAMDDYNNAGHFRHMGEYGSALHAVAYASSSRAGLFEGNVKISGDLEVTTTWHDPALSLSSYGDGNALSTYYGDVDINNGNLIVSGWEASRVGIGTETPNKQLHIYSDNENAEINIQSGQNTHWGIYQDEWSGDMLFWNEQNRVIFTDYGYVGIGTTTPEYMLDVGGDVRAFEFCLDYTCINTWEDLADILGIAPSAAN